MNPTPADNNDLNQNLANQNDSAQVPQLQSETPLDLTIYPSNENPQQIIEPETFTMEPEKKSNPVNTISSENIEITTTPTTETYINPAPAALIPSEEMLNQKSVSENTQVAHLIENIQPTPATEMQGQPLPPLPPLPDIKKTLNFGEEAANSTTTENLIANPLQNKESFLNNVSNQKLITYGGIILGIAVAGIIASFIYISRQTQTKPTTPTTTPTLQTLAPIVVTPTTPTQTLTLEEYQIKIDALNTKYQTTISTNPLNLTSNVLSTETVKFIGDEIFAIATEIDELRVPESAILSNSRLSQELKILVGTYDELLKSYKTSNALTNEMKTKFNTNLKASNDRLKVIFEEIKNLK